MSHAAQPSAAKPDPTGHVDGYPRSSLRFSHRPPRRKDAYAALARAHEAQVEESLLVAVGSGDVMAVAG